MSCDMLAELSHFYWRRGHGSRMSGLRLRGEYIRCVYRLSRGGFWQNGATHRSHHDYILPKGGTAIQKQANQIVSF